MGKVKASIAKMRKWGYNGDKAQITFSGNGFSVMKLILFFLTLPSLPVLEILDCLSSIIPNISSFSQLLATEVLLTPVSSESCRVDNRSPKLFLKVVIFCIITISTRKSSSPSLWITPITCFSDCKLCRRSRWCRVFCWFSG